MQPDLSPAEYRQTVDHELGMDEPLEWTRVAEVLQAWGATCEEFAAGLSRAATGYCCEAGRVCAPDPCPWHEMGDSGGS